MWETIQLAAKEILELTWNTMDGIIGNLLEMTSTYYQKPSVVMMPTLSSLVALQVVIITTYGATGDGQVGIIMTSIAWHLLLQYSVVTSLHSQLKQWQ